jgi:rubredoxin
MLSEVFHPYISGRHGSGMPGIRATESLRFGTKWENVPSQFVCARNEKSFEVGTPEHTTMLSEEFHADISGRHSSAMPRIRAAKSLRFGTKWENVPNHFV